MRDGGNLTSKALEWVGTVLVAVASIALTALLVIDLSDVYGRYVALIAAIACGLAVLLLARWYADG